MSELTAPWPWFGGKSRAAHIVWPRFGDTPNYVEPFAGSLAVLLRRPHWSENRREWLDDSHTHVETVNDLDGAVCNFWRATQHDPEQVAVWADNPVIELDLHARHLWLHERLKSTEGLSALALSYAADKGALPFAGWLATEPTAYDCQVAGWWAWGLSSWIGGSWCRPTRELALPHLGGGQGVNRRRPHLGDVGQGVNRKLPHLGDAGQGVNRKRPHLGGAGQGVNRQLPTHRESGTGIGACAAHRAALIDWFGLLRDRLRHVDVCCGDWERVCGFTPTEKRAAPAAVFLDPPYSQDVGLDTVYGELHDPDVSARVRRWCIERGASPDLRIALCGYDTEHGELEQHGWTAVAWKAGGGYGNQGDESRGRENSTRERIWFSPGCLPEEPGLFGDDHA